MPAGAPRLHAIDGIRGWAAFSVMCFHFVQMFEAIEPSLSNPVGHLFLNGDLDVAVFFVLSGDALSTAYWRNGSQSSVVRLALKRYTRLSIPILAASLIAYALLQAGLFRTAAAAPVLHQEAWLGSFYQHRYNPLSVVTFAFADVYFHHAASSSLVPPLWTMGIELLGSVLVFLILLADHHIARKTLTLLALAAFLLMARSFLACFVFGILFGHWRTLGVFARLQARSYAPVFLAGAIAAMVLAANLLGSGTIRIPQIDLASVAFVFCVFANPFASRLFSARLSQWLGEISFPLYLTHFPILSSYTAGVVVWADAKGILDAKMVAFLILTSIALSLALAVAFRPVETLTRKIGDALCRFVAVVPVVR